MVVVSGQEGLDDKPTLAALAAERMGIGVEGAVLIDNIERNVSGLTTSRGTSPASERSEGRATTSEVKSNSSPT
ncbi:MAG: hypothetical protein ACYCZV_06960 [Acidimicrobiales bacterium]